MQYGNVSWDFAEHHAHHSLVVPCKRASHGGAWRLCNGTGCAVSSPRSALPKDSLAWRTLLLAQRIQVAAGATRRPVPSAAGLFDGITAVLLCDVDWYPNPTEYDRLKQGNDARFECMRYLSCRIFRDFFCTLTMHFSEKCSFISDNFGINSVLRIPRSGRRK